MAIRLWPSDYKNKSQITKEEKSMLNNAARNFNSGHFAVEIDPVGMSSDQIKMGMYINPNEGLLTYSLMAADSINSDFADNYLQLVEMTESRIYTRLMDSKMLIVRNGEHKLLKFPYKHVLLFYNVKPGKTGLSDEVKSKLQNYVCISFFRTISSEGKEKYTKDLKIFDGIRKKYCDSYKQISENEQIAIFERLAPEYTIVLNEIEKVNVSEVDDFVTKEDLLITGKEQEYKTFYLDEYQVNLVNEMRPGHRVILANPGAGKSVLLLSKAFKYASIYKKQNILLTCYNNNLADSYQFKRSCADFGENRNLYIMTFHKLVKKIYRECLNIQMQDTNIATDEEIQRCITYIKEGKLNLKFKAIFIDEVQIFDPLYLTLCYLLLEKSPDSTFLMTGDLNQNVRALSRSGEAPWKKMQDITLDFSGRVRYIEKNYRNSIGIAKYIQRMLTHMNNRLNMLGLINSLEFDYNTFTIGNKPTIALKVITGVKRNDIQKSVIRAIREISTDYDISYSDIAVLFPYRQHKSLRYYVLYWVKSALEENDIHYSIISSTDTLNERKKYSDTTGVVLTTIDSSLGLDFKAVILAGIFPYNYVFNSEGKPKKISSWKRIKDLSEEDQLKVQQQFRSMYTACSRARDVLYVISDLEEGSPMEEILKQ